MIKLKKKVNNACEDTKSESGDSISSNEIDVPEMDDELNPMMMI